MERRVFLSGLFSSALSSLVVLPAAISQSSSAAFAATAGPVSYYVSPTGSDSNAGTSPESPFRTLRTAAALTLPGDTVYVMNGDYQDSGAGTSVLSIKRSGLAGAPITYAAYPGHRPRILCNANNWQGIKIAASYIRVVGFEVAGSANTISYDYALSQMNNGSNTATNAAGIVVDGRSTGTLHHIDIIDNLVHHCPGSGISIIAADYITVEANTVHSCANWSPWNCSGISIYSARDTDTNTTKYKIRVERNITFDNEAFIPDPSLGRITDGNGIIIDDNMNKQNTGVPAYKGRTRVANNLSFNNGGTGMHAYSSAYVDFVNNTSYFNNRSPVLDNGEINVKSCTTVRLYNNISFARDGKACQNFKSNTGVFSDFNIYHNGIAAFRGSNDKVMNPNFTLATIDPASADFRPISASEAMKTGTTKLAPVNDIVGRTRSNLLIDRGAYQMSALTRAAKVR